MNWQIAVAGHAGKQLNRFPAKDKDRIKRAIDEMEQDPFVGDIEKMIGQENAWRRRVGAYRIFYEVFINQKMIRIVAIRRRASNTY